MTREKFEEIFKVTYSDWKGDNAIQGLTIIMKYIKDKDIICGADHDVIYSVDIDDLIEAGITEADATALATLNWIIYDGEYMACFV